MIHLHSFPQDLASGYFGVFFWCTFLYQYSKKNPTRGYKVPMLYLLGVFIAQVLLFIFFMWAVIHGLDEAQKGYNDADEGDSLLCPGRDRPDEEVVRARVSCFFFKGSAFANSAHAVEVLGPCFKLLSVAVHGL